MKLPVVDEKEVVPVRLIPLITHGKLGRKTIADVLAHELKICESRQREHEAVVAEMKAERMGIKPENSITPMAEILSGEGAEESGDTLNWVEPFAYRLNAEGRPERIPVAEWRIVGLEIRPLIELAHRKEDEIGIEGAYRHEWHTETLKCIPADAFMWKADLERLFPAAKINYSRWSREELRLPVQDAVDCLNAAIKKPTPRTKESTRAIETLQKMLVVLAKDGYRYDPEAKNNGDALKDMQNAFCDAGLSVADNTLRNHLKAGALLIDRLKN